MKTLQAKMISIAFPPTEADVIDFVHRWTCKLVDQDYATAYEMLCRVDQYPGRAWVSSPAELKEWITNYGSDTPIEGEPSCIVTELATATGSRPNSDLEFTPIQARYPGCVGRLDWPLPLNEEWSDLQASFDLVMRDGQVAFVLVALSVP